ncbi:hypothetical protein KJ764_04190 [Patescibacteria group bacterium]|nr:hypothetical protein [Patescibacteria group bacterium]
MKTFLLLYIAKILLVLMLVPLYKDYRRRTLRHARVEAWRERNFNSNNRKQNTLFPNQ